MSQGGSECQDTGIRREWDEKTAVSLGWLVDRGHHQKTVCVQEDRKTT